MSDHERGRGAVSNWGAAGHLCQGQVWGASVGVSYRVTPPKGAAIKATVAKLDGIWDPALVTNTRQTEAEVFGFRFSVFG